ncbi:MAG: hypothetical protein MI975_02560 [Cytophagales bacterium]|nr:hypothetical protein [Cytophagales bacterium]
MGFILSACASQQPKYTYLSKEKIRKIKKVLVVIEPLEKAPEIIDLGGIRDQSFNAAFAGGPEMWGLIGVLIAGGIAEATNSYQIKKAIGGNKDEITDELTHEDLIKPIFVGISETFRKKTSECEYIDFDEIIFTEISHEDAIITHAHKMVDNVLAINYRYGIGVSKKFPAQPVITASVAIFNPKSNQIIQKSEVSSGFTSIYDSLTDVPTFEEYSANGAALFKKDLHRAAEIIGAEVARLYTFY